MANFDWLKLRQLDAVLAAFKPVVEQRRPRSGWAKAIRTALGMTTRQLAERMAVRQPSVTELEQNERTGAITLASLERLAAALECKLVYGFVPLRGSLEATLRHRASAKANEIVSRVGTSMQLENQGVDDRTRDWQVERLIEELLATGPRSLWDEPAGD